MENKLYDIAIIGGGPGGYVAAIRASQLGFKTAVVEKDKLGGVCLNWGCIPTKALLKNAEIYNHFKHANEFGITYQNLEFDFKKIIKRSRDVVLRNSKGVEYLFKKNKIDHISGFGKIIGKGKIEVSKDGKPVETVESKHIIIATGARPRSIPDVAIDRKKIISSSEAMILQEVPKSMLIIGAGAIGVEFSYFYNTFGTKVTLVEMMPSILPIEDKEITKLLESNLKKVGIEIFTDTKVEKVTVGGDVTLTVNTKEGAKELKGDVALMAIGVQGNVENIGLDEIGVKYEKSFIKVDKYYRTNVEGVYAIGDIIGQPLLAHVASAEGITCIEAIAGKSPAVVDYENIPGCTYCQPQVASIGFTEDKAIEQGYEIKVGRFPFAASGKARAIGETDGLVKLIFHAKYGELLGAHILGSDATEMIAEIGVAKTLGTTAHELIKTVHAHPTLSEAVMEAAANAMGKAIHI
ncbi:MAG: dihydrolipoyl dehydrogenase [Bacteroidetes bacterium]|nr:dihydrolipoyl dehydrogenase [Bacteroidota bacterium]MBU1422965.1 dihydrolipoyl dehydrogenase [Bacteroidota bacterium]MBU2471653.1 dihydrolipoyl dehydrogenase [Bacteroidota bacterium]